MGTESNHTNYNAAEAEEGLFTRTIADLYDKEKAFTVNVIEIIPSRPAKGKLEYRVLDLVQLQSTLKTDKFTRKKNYTPVKL